MKLSELIGAIVLEASRVGVDPVKLDIDYIDVDLNSDIETVEVIVCERTMRVTVV